MNEWMNERIHIGVDDGEVHTGLGVVGIAVCRY